jgi:hypothetical protein
MHTFIYITSSKKYKVIVPLTKCISTVKTSKNQRVLGEIEKERDRG